MKGIKIIGFDLDNTLYPATPEIQKRIRGKIYEKLAFLLEISVEKARDLFEEKYPTLMSGSKSINQIAKECGKEKEINGSDIVQDSLQEADILDLIEENKELNEMLERLSEKRKLILLTGTRRGLAMEKLKKLGINKDIFSEILADEHGSKSSGELYKKFLEKIDIMPGEILYVGDNEKQDVDVPRSLGIKTCIVGEYDKAGFQINNILDLEKLFQNSFNSSHTSTY